MLEFDRTNNHIVLYSFLMLKIVHNFWSLLGYFFNVFHFPSRSILVLNTQQPVIRVEELFNKII